MGMYHKSFESTMAKIGFIRKELPTAVFYSTPIGIRFKIGDSEELYLPNSKEINPVYVDNAFGRAKALFHDLPCRPNLLRIDNYPEEADKINLQTLSQIGLPVPEESIQEQHIDHVQEHLYWDLMKGNCQIEKLLLEIIKGDFTGGFSCLCSSVYLLNTESSVLYHLYDDRGADIVASDKHLLLPLYQKYNDWILYYDKANIDKLFKD